LKANNPGLTKYTLATQALNTRQSLIKLFNNIKKESTQDVKIHLFGYLSNAFYIY